MVEIYLIQHISYQLWKSNRKEQLLWPKPCIEAVNTAHPFNQTARLKQTFWRPSPTTTTTGGGGGGFEPPALEIRQPIMHPSLQQAVNDDEERLYFKVGAEQGPTDPVTFNQVVSPIVIKAKVLWVKNKAWYSSPWIWRVLDTAHLSNPTCGLPWNGTQKTTHASYKTHPELSFNTSETSATGSLLNQLEFQFQFWLSAQVAWLIGFIPCVGRFVLPDFLTLALAEKNTKEYSTAKAKGSLQPLKLRPTKKGCRCLLVHHPRPHLQALQQVASIPPVPNSKKKSSSRRSPEYVTRYIFEIPNVTCSNCLATGTDSKANIHSLLMFCHCRQLVSCGQTIRYPHWSLTARTLLRKGLIAFLPHCTTLVKVWALYFSERIGDWMFGGTKRCFWGDEFVDYLKLKEESTCFYLLCCDVTKSTEICSKYTDRL